MLAAPPATSSSPKTSVVLKRKATAENLIIATRREKTKKYTLKKFDGIQQKVTE
jgi:hypothetical protein